MDIITPQGFRSFTGRIGLRDQGDDFTVLVSDGPAACAAVFTRSRFAGPSVEISRQAMGRQRARGVVVIAKNANVATGKEGLDNALEVRRTVAEVIGVAEDELLVASTGVIGRQYPMPEVRAVMEELRWPFPEADFGAVATAIMTTDTKPKTAAARCGAGTIVGVAKGVGMLEPNMATLLTFFCTDADLSDADLDQAFRQVMDRTFNALSIDTDTSTSDTAAVFANGRAGAVDLGEFTRALEEVALHLVREIARDGEGASKLIEVRVSGARDDDQAKLVGKTVVNSPLVKTAVHGADPNWGRVAMAIGKCEAELDIAPERVRIGFGDQEVYPGEVDAAGLDRLRSHLQGDEVVIRIDLGIGAGGFTVYGCDLSEGYVRLNADYTT